MREHPYERVARLVRESLGEPGSSLPSEAELMREHEVGRSTVRAALAMLEAEGLISVSKGARRTVRSTHRWCWPMSSWEKRHTADADAWANSVKAQGGEPSSEVRVSIVPASLDVAKSLDVKAGESIVVRSRVRSVDGEPHQLSDSYFPRWLTDAHPVFLEPGDLAAPGGLLAAAGVPQVRYFDALTARMPTQEESQTLHVGPGTPLLVHHRTGFDAKDRPVRFMVTRSAADRVEISYQLDA